MGTAGIVSFVIYLLVVLAVAGVAYWVTHSLSDYVLGGRRLNGPVAALSSGASDMSAWLLLGLPGAAYLYGANQIWLPIGLVLGAYINWRWIAAPLRVYTERAKDSITLPSFLEHRFEDTSHWIRLCSSVATLLFFSVYTASGLVGGALLMERTFDLSFEMALFSGTSIIVLYTFVGGFLAVSWTDFVQGIFMFLCLLVLSGVLYAHLKEAGSLTQQAMEVRSAGFLNPMNNMTWISWISLMAWGLGYFGQPHILVRFMAVRTLKDIPVARRVLMTWMILALLGAWSVGILGALHLRQGISNHESVFIDLSQVFFTPWFAGVIMAAILSSIMCAIDSQMLASTSALTEDIYHPLVRPRASQKELIWVGRWGLIVIALVAVFLAWFSGRGVLDLVSFSWAGLAATFGAPVVGALFWRRMTRNGAVAAMVLGSLSSVLFSFKPDWFFGIYHIVPGVLASVAGAIVFSYVGEAPSHKQLALFDAVWDELHSNTDNKKGAF